MAKGQPDFGAYAPTETIVGLSDIGELAARLGSPVTFHRMGNVVFIETFDGSLSKCLTDTGGTGGSIRISNEASQHGDFSCKMVTGDAADDYSVLYVRLAYPVLSKMGVEICWHMPDDSGISDISLNLYLYDGIKNWRAYVNWEVATDTWAYWDGADWVVLSPTVAYFEGETQFNHTKLIVDLVNKKYVRLIANNLSYDLTGIAIPSIASGLNAQLLAEVLTYARVDGCCTIFLDSMIITQNEP